MIINHGLAYANSFILGFAIDKFVAGKSEEFFDIETIQRLNSSFGCRYFR